MKTRRIRQGKAIIIELKVAESINNMEKACEKAVGQIEKFHYDKVMMLQKERCTEIPDATTSTANFT